jgi:putative oxidoreductase
MVDNRSAPYGVFVLRLTLGVMFVAHAMLKLLVFTPAGFAAFLGKVGFPEFMAWPVMLAELLGGVALILGLYSRYVAVALLPVLAGAALVHIPNGWVFNAPNGGWEYPLFLIVIAAAVALLGDGAFALRTSIRPRLAAPVARQA